MLIVFEMRCWPATACGRKKMDAGRRSFWVVLEKCQGVLQTCLSHFSVLLWLGVSSRLINPQASLSQKLHLSFIIHLTSVFSSFHLFPPLKTPISELSVWAAALLSVTENVNPVRSECLDLSSCCTLNLCQN